MKTPLASDPSRRAQPLRQTRNNPPRSAIVRPGPYAPRGSLGGVDDAPEPVEIFPAITNFADAITALPKELVRHFTLLKEVDAKIFAPEEDLGQLVEEALNTPLPERQQSIEAHHALAPASAPMSSQGSFNGSIINGHVGSVASIPDAVDIYNPAMAAYDPVNIPRRKLFQHCAYTMNNMLVSLDEKNHVISTAAEVLNKQLARIDDCFQYIQLEISEEAQHGSLTHWAYPENRTNAKSGGGNSRRDLGTGNNISAATQHLVEEAAARSDARKQALLAKRSNKHLAESDFDDHHDARHKESTKKLHGNSKIRKAADASLVGLGITNGTTTNGNPPKRRKVDKGPTGGTAMERALSGVFGNNGTASKKPASPRETPPGDAPKKRQRNTAATNGHSRKRNNTVTSIAMSPSLASSPIRSTFPDTKASGRSSPAPANGGKPATAKGRQNSIQTTVEKGASPAPTKQNGTVAGTPDLAAAAVVTGKTITEVKASMKESATNSKGEHVLEDVDKEDLDLIGGIVVGERKNSTMKREEPETNGDAMQGIQTTTVTLTKSGRASKPSTPALQQFPEPVRSRSSRNTIETASSNSNKRSHKKGAGAAAQQLIISQQQNNQASEADEGSSMQGDDEDAEIGEDEPRYCYCNGVSYGEMVGCDAGDCEREWFHLECVGLKVAPRGNAKWYCDDCKEKLKHKRFNSRS